MDLGTQQRDALADHSVDLERLAFGLYPFSREHPNTIDHVTGAFGVANDSEEASASLSDLRLRAFEPLNTRLAVRNDRRERLTDLMSDGSRERPQTVHPEKPREFGVFVEGKIARVGLRRYIEDCPKVLRHRTRSTDPRVAETTHVRDDAVRPCNEVLVLERDPPSDRSPDGTLEAQSIGA